MREFTSKWLKFSPEGRIIGVPKVAEGGSATSATGILGSSGQGVEVDKAKIGPDHPGSVEELLDRLRNGHRWLSETQLKLLEERPVYEGMEDSFLAGLDGWDNLDQALRKLNYDACVMGPDRSCPSSSPVSCRGCSMQGRVPVRQPRTVH